MEEARWLQNEVRTAGRRRRTERHELPVSPLDKVRNLVLPLLKPLVEPLRENDAALLLARDLPAGFSLPDRLDLGVDRRQVTGRLLVPAANAGGCRERGEWARQGVEKGNETNLGIRPQTRRSISYCPVLPFFLMTTLLLLGQTCV